MSDHSNLMDFKSYQSHQFYSKIKLHNLKICLNIAKSDLTAGIMNLELFNICL